MIRGGITFVFLFNYLAEVYVPPDVSGNPSPLQMLRRSRPSRTRPTFHFAAPVIGTET